MPAIPDIKFKPIPPERIAKGMVFVFFSDGHIDQKHGKDLGDHPGTQLVLKEELNQQFLHLFTESMAREKHLLERFHIVVSLFPFGRIDHKR